MVQTIGGYSSSLNSKSEIPHKTLANTTRAPLLKPIQKKNFGALPISIPYVSPTELRIYCVVMFLTSSGMEHAEKIVRIILMPLAC